MPPLILAWFPFLQAIYTRSAEASIPDVTSLTQFLVYCSPRAPCCLCDFIRDLYPNLPVIFLLFVKSFVFLKFLVKDKGRLKICRSVRPLIVPIDNTEEGRVFFQIPDPRKSKFHRVLCKKWLDLLRNDKLYIL